MVPRKKSNGKKMHKEKSEHAENAQTEISPQRLLSNERYGNVCVYACAFEFVCFCVHT